jgi:hypothetical protein
MSLAERYSRAAISGNLRNDELHGATDVLAAMALSGTFGAMLVRVKYCNDVGSYHRLLHQWTWIVSTRALRRNWPEHIPINTVAYMSLRRWLNSVCPACTGLGYIKELGAPVLSDRPCKLCKGTGVTELRCEMRVRDYVLDMVDELETDMLRAVTRAKKKLRSAREDADAKMA